MHLVDHIILKLISIGLTKILILIVIGKALLPLSTAGSQALAEIIGEPVEYSEQPVLLAEDFNINFSLPEAEPLLAFLREKFSLEMINGRNDPTTKGGTTIDAVFARNIDKIDVRHFISYFSYHNPIGNIIDMNPSEPRDDH
ncbi:hypothetical protein WwAna0671 [Wolbachia endosymbiont of Drosophila ananassae]|nr:hypothetical protein WwAna0671 [Wolbachia endosymbiont of Drosophila ananassae]